MNVIIRPYKVSDRAAIRQICADTADCGKPIEHSFFDREVLADLAVSYYTDFEPRSLWVAESDGQVVGYLSGCTNSRRYLCFMAGFVFPKALLRALFRGIFLRAQIYRFIRAAFKSWRLGGFNRKLSLDEFPAHLHIDIKDGFRGAKVGSRLMENFFAQAESMGMPGIYLVALEGNTSACRFFEHVGFSIAGRYPVVVANSSGFRLDHSVLYVKKVFPPNE